ncbi:hypothetical protein Poly30_01640 [Planctomycetes bacterium Poly30]|uniref:WD domain, G-beta repeat n=1 Tax=Saltatorellus ferox TaxID=2528018 RepID=A0A518EKQ8_9BACT|nr:hypothetical protein Poly30_01640 [Planctomycetes bacterium Poly30]
MPGFEAGKAAPRPSGRPRSRPGTVAPRFTPASKTPDGVPVAGLEVRERRVAGSELCFVSEARVAQRAPVAVGTSRGQPVRIFGEETGAVLAEYEIPADEQDVISLDIDDAGERVAMLDYGYRVWLWDWKTGGAPELVGALPGWEPVEDPGLAMATIRFGPGSERIVVGQALSGAALLGRAGQLIRRVGTGIDLSGEAPPAELPGFVVDVRQTSWSEDGSRVLFLVDGWPRLLDASTGDEIPVLMETHLSLVEQIALSPDGQWMATSHLGNEVALTHLSDGLTAWLRVFDVPKPDWPVAGSPELTERERRRGIHGLEFSADGRLVAVALDGPSRLALLDLSTGRVLGYSGPEPPRDQDICEVERFGTSGFLLTPLPCGFVHRVRMAENGRRVLHDIEGLSTPPDVGWGGRLFFAGENEYQLNSPEEWTTLWSVPIQDW